jgi:hypothetical protein
MTSKCDSCKYEIDSVYFNEHNCTYEKNVREMEVYLHGLLEENKKLMLQNEELKNGVNTIKGEIEGTYAKLRGVVENVKETVYKTDC